MLPRHSMDPLQFTNCGLLCEVQKKLGRVCPGNFWIFGHPHISPKAVSRWLTFLSILHFQLMTSVCICVHSTSSSKLVNKRVQALDIDSYATMLDFEAFYRFSTAWFAIQSTLIIGRHTCTSEAQSLVARTHADLVVGQPIPVANIWVFWY